VALRPRDRLAVLAAAGATMLDFDPRTDVKSVEDLALFPNIVNELRDARVEDLIPWGYGPNPDIVGVYESGGTTGAPKRVVFLRDWLDRATMQPSYKRA
jgi:phenylacetate-coenzyme A ligase PaaK-like adenylate-forming protein